MKVELVIYMVLYFSMMNLDGAESLAGEQIADYLLCIMHQMEKGNRLRMSIMPL